MANPRWVKDAPDTTTPYLFCNKVYLQFSLYWQALVRTRHHWKRLRRVVGKTGSDIQFAITWKSMRFHGQLWRGVRSLCRCHFFCCSSHKHTHHWRPCPRTGQRCCFRALLLQVLRHGFVDHFLESFIAGDQLPRRALFRSAYRSVPTCPHNTKEHRTHLRMSSSRTHPLTTTHATC